MSTTQTDLLIIGGGPAGLSAATFFARVNRPFIVYDSQLYRNSQSPESHTIMGYERISPAEYRSKIQMELCSLYGKGGLDNGVFKNGKIASLEKVDGGFEAVDEDGNKVRARKVVLATGIKDILPPIPGKCPFPVLCRNEPDWQDYKKHGVNELSTASFATVPKLTLNLSHTSLHPTTLSMRIWHLHSSNYGIH